MAKVLRVSLRWRDEGVNRDLVKIDEGGAYLSGLFLIELAELSMVKFENLSDCAVSEGVCSWVTRHSGRTWAQGKYTCRTCIELPEYWLVFALP